MNPINEHFVAMASHDKQSQYAYYFYKSIILGQNNIRYCLKNMKLVSNVMDSKEVTIDRLKLRILPNIRLFYYSRHDERVM
jgi:hypothetical protein